MTLTNDYTKKTREQLLYIIKDAGEASHCMRGVSITAELKYLDQVNDAATTLYKMDQRLKGKPSA